MVGRSVGQRKKNSLRASSPIWASGASLALLAQIGELARRLFFLKKNENFVFQFTFAYYIKSHVLSVRYIIRW